MRLGRILALVAVAAFSNCDCGGMEMPDGGLPILEPSPIDPTIVTHLADATAFLYSGANPVQTGVRAGAIERRRVTVLRGTTRGADSAMLSGLTVRILGHSELGQTPTRADGAFDVAANGGAPVTLMFEKGGYLPVQRQVVTPVLDHGSPVDVVLLPVPRPTFPTFLDAQKHQAILGPKSVGADGERQPFLLLPPGTQASLVLPSAETRPVASLSLRITEHTVGDAEPDAMPGVLPANSAYTHAVEFPTGTSIPAGYCDRERGVWVASDSGRVIAILGVSGGLARLDIDGDGLEDGGPALQALGITDGERQALAEQSETARNLWRVPILHLSSWDKNLGFSPPEGAVPLDKDPETPPSKDDPCDEGGGPRSRTAA
jgi:hypothetical protein